MSMASALLWMPLTGWAIFSSERFPVEAERRNVLIHVLSTLAVCIATFMPQTRCWSR